MSSFNLTLKPSQNEFVVTPGVTFTQAYTVSNNSDSSIILSTEVLPWLPINTDGSLTYSNVPKNPFYEFSLGNSDLKIGQTFILRPNENRQLVLKIKTSPSTPHTDAYFTFFVSQDLSNSIYSDTSQSASVARIGSHLLLSASTTENPVSQIAITKFTSSPQIKDIFYPSIRLDAQISNTSNYFTKTVGKLTLTKNNKVIKEYELFPHNVLAQSSRTIACNSNNLPVPCTLDPPFWPGPYTATLQTNDSSASITFFVFPYSLVAILILASALIFSLTKLFYPHHLSPPR